MKLPSFFNRQKKPEKKEPPSPEEKKAIFERVQTIIGVIGVSALAYIVLKITEEEPYSMYVLIAYLIVTAVLTAVYLIYNRGLSRNGVTVDMLPDTMSDAEKQEFIDSAKRRLKASKWMLMLLLPFIISFAVYAFELFVIDTYFIK